VGRFAVLEQAGRNCFGKQPVKKGCFFHSIAGYGIVPARREAAQQGAEAKALLQGDPVCRADAGRADAIRADAIRADAVSPYGVGRAGTHVPAAHLYLRYRRRQCRQSATKENKHRKGASALDVPGEILIMMSRGWRF